MFSLLALDFDGVILDSMEIKTEAMRRVGEPFGPELRDRLVLYQRIEGGISRFEKFRWLYQEAYGREITDKEMAALSAQYLSHIDDALKHCPLLPGVLDVLTAWHGRVPIYVCSGAPQSELVVLLRERGLDRYFTAIRGYPPAKTPLLAGIIREAGVAASAVVMVGDTVTDSRAAEENGTLFYGIGAMFSGSAHPHGDNLHDLNAWLKTSF